MKSVKYGRRFSLSSMASLATALVLIDGPLLQRASSVKRPLTVDEISLDLSVATQLPEGFSARKIEGNWVDTPAALEVFNQHINNKSIVSDTYCDGECRATIRAPGYTSMDCWNQSWPITEAMLRNPNSVRKLMRRTLPLSLHTATHAANIAVFQARLWRLMHSLILLPVHFRHGASGTVDMTVRT